MSNNNNNFNNFQRNYNPRLINQLSISEQLDLLYNENNKLKSYINEKSYQNEELIQSLEEKICSLEYDKSVAIKDNNQNYKLYSQQINSLNQEIFHLKELLNQNSDDKEKYKEEYCKLEERYRVANEYIKLLPTLQELDRLNVKLCNAQKSNERYKSQLQETKSTIRNLENELSRTRAELGNSNDRTVLMKSQMDVLSEKLCNIRFHGEVKEECTEDWSSPPDLIEDMRLTLERYKIDLVQSKQIIESERKKSQQITINYQNQIDELQKQLDSESETISTLRREMEHKQFLCNDLENKLKSAAYQKQDILGSMMDLQIEIDRLDHFGSDLLQQLFNKLFSEMILCIGDVETVSQCLWKLAHKEELDVSELLGSATMDTLTLSEPNSKDFNKAYLEQELNNVKQLRERMSQIRASITQFYTNQVASDVKFCITQ